MNAISPDDKTHSGELPPGELAAFVIDEILRDTISAFQPNADVSTGGPGAAAAGMAGSNASIVFVELPQQPWTVHVFSLPPRPRAA